MRDFESGELRLAHALAHQAALATQLGRLSRRSKSAAIVEERNRLARDIHDTLAQGLTGIVIQLRAAKDAWLHGLIGEATSHHDRAVALARDSLQEARRSVRALRPKALEEGSLVQALEEMFARVTSDTQMSAKLVVEGEPRRLGSLQEDNLLRVSQEIVTNAMKHADASEFSVVLHFHPESVLMDFSDDGCGFDPLAKSEGFGLLGIKERVEAMGGILEIISSPARGTVVTLSLPVTALPDPTKP